MKSYRDELKNKQGIYGIVNTINNKQYIGSSKDLYVRLLEHVAGKKSNSALQKGIAKYGLNKFYFCVYEYYENDQVVGNKTLVELETEYIKNFDLTSLYNFKRTATSMLGYKHTEQALLKMIARYKDKKNHPFFGKTHTKETKNLISKPGAANPMFGKKHSEKSKLLMSIKKNKSPNGVGLYDLNLNLLEKFNNNVELAKYLNISKTTVGRYIVSGKVYNSKYYIKYIPLS